MTKWVVIGLLLFTAYTVYGQDTNNILVIGAIPDTAKPFEAYQSGGNCVYIVKGRYANFITAVPVGLGGC